MLKIKHLTLQQGSKILLDKADLYINTQQKVGIIGKNGCGKSSFFNLLLGKIEATHGEIEINKNLNIAHLQQEIPNSKQTAIEFVIDGDAEYRQLQQAINIAEAKQDGMQLANLHEKMQHIDGYNITTRAGTLLHGLGIDSSQCQQPLNAFSGGWQIRINLAKTLMTRADIFLLDEPTNHLDLETIDWLEKWLATLKATLLIISHDRDFLDNVCDHIAHIDQKTIKFYSGNYSSFEKQRSEQMMLQQATYEKQQKQRQHLQSFVDRFRYKATKAKQAQSRLKALEKMQLLEPAHYDSQFSFQFLEPSKCPKPLIRLDDLSIGYDKVLASNINLTINPGDRFGFLGKNGAGKSTLTKILAKQQSPLSGKIFFHNDLKTAYFTQHQADSLDLSASPLLHLQRLDPTVSEQEGRNFLGQFNFHGEQSTDPIKHFSGGEKARLALAVLIWQRPNLLLLDEPTNHFDLDMRHALTLALQNFSGAMVLISHDRHLMKTTVDELFLLDSGRFQVFKHSISDYPNCLDNHSLKSNIASGKKAPSKKVPLERELKNIEKQIAQYEQKLQQLQEELIAKTSTNTPDQEAISRLAKQQSMLESKIEELEQLWLNKHAD